MNSNPYHDLLNKTFERCIPFTVHWELTYRCNLSCRHCYIENTSASSELQPVEIDGLLQQLKAIGTLFLAFTGGEFLCRPDNREILALISRYRFAYHFFTNGTLLTPDIALQIKTANPVAVEISLYATQPEVHDAITGTAGSHKRTMDGIRACQAAGLPLVLKMMVLRANCSEFPAVRDFARSINAGFKFDFVLVPADNGTPRMAQHGLNEEEIAAFARKYADRHQPQPKAPAADDFLCGAGRNVLCINPYGDVYPCLAIRRAIGNVRQQPLREIWRTGALDNLRQARHNVLQECKGCRYVAYCARCSGVALAETGRLFGASPSACMAARAICRGLGKI